jgi:hypothetical protein
MLEALVGACLGKEALGQVILGVEVSVWNSKADKIINWNTHCQTKYDQNMM